MAIDKVQLETDIKTLLNSLKTEEGDQQGAIDHFASVLADKIADAIKRGIETATITHTLTAGTYPVTGTITLNATK